MMSNADSAPPLESPRYNTFIIESEKIDTEIGKRVFHHLIEEHPQLARKFFFQALRQKSVNLRLSLSQ